MDGPSFRRLVEEAIQSLDMSIIGILDASSKLRSVPTESSFLAKLVEVSVLRHLKEAITRAGLVYETGGERAYPDAEGYDPVAETYYAVDVKCASTDSRFEKFKSRPTLYSFGTYLKHRDQKTVGIMRPYNDYQIHLDVMVIYEVNYSNPAIIEECIARKTSDYIQHLARTYPVFSSFDMCVVEAWRVASHLMSSRTRDYVGSVQSIERFKNEQGVFATKDAFLAFWSQLPSKNAEVLNRVFGNSKELMPSSHCTVEEFAELIGRDVVSLVHAINSDPAFPVFSPDGDTYNLDSTYLPGRLLYPYIAAKYMGVPDNQIHNIEQRLFRLREDRGKH